MAAFSVATSLVANWRRTSTVLLLMGTPSPFILSTNFVTAFSSDFLALKSINWFKASVRENPLNTSSSYLRVHEEAKKKGTNTHALLMSPSFEYLEMVSFTAASTAFTLGAA